jgi:formylglycine-generating enzyme required for sulfatase activity
VAVDETFRGLTPLEIVVRPDRPHEIEVTKAGYELAVREIRAAPGEISEVAVTLTPRVGEIHVVATPDDAELVVDGEVVGTANQVLRLGAVPHEIEIRKDGYRDFRTTVTPRVGFPQSVEVALASEEEVRARATPPSIRSPQGQELILIDGGRFRMGASRREPGRRANETLRDIDLTRRFYLSVTEVSNREFREFQGNHISGQVGGVNLEIDDHPVVRVTWEDAARYCNWLSEKDGLPPVYIERGGHVVGVRPVGIGYRLPTEAEWAWAARYAGRENPLKYPWGDALPVVEASGNYADESAKQLVGFTLDGYEDPYPATGPVESFGPNDIGLLNVGGNVAEWVHDIYTIHASKPGVVELDPLGPEEGDLHVIRGSSWMDASVSELRLTYRDYGGNPRPDVGFRIARYAE